MNAYYNELSALCPDKSSSVFSCVSNISTMVPICWNKHKIVKVILQLHIYNCLSSIITSSEAKYLQS